MSKRVWPQSISLKLPTLRFRGKVMLGFAVVLAISAASMGIAYLGFERVSSGVTTYRNSVSEASVELLTAETEPEVTVPPRLWIASAMPHTVPNRPRKTKMPVR